ncbi:MAG: MlaE family lipid ABC transporter permease subunit [Candidatus Latescibacteria bacterium]|nr:MlaE family lipid ABC transporter permease subunit [Candidatus Latescibacterota bacterium]
MTQVHSDDGGLRFVGPLTQDVLAPLASRAQALLKAHPQSVLTIDLDQVTDLDLSGAVFLHHLAALAADKQVHLSPLPDPLQTLFDFTRGTPVAAPTPAQSQSRLEQLGDYLYRSKDLVADFCYLMSDLTWAAIATLFRRRDIRRGAFVEQALTVGAQGLPIVALILFLIGAVSILQSAAQLRQFGAVIYTANLLAIGLTRELGPLMTAIIVSGRSGSAIAAEIATMKFTEELDSLKTMGLDPLRFVAVPKLWAMLLCVPLLTIMADFIGLLGGALVGIGPLEIAPSAFLAQVQEALFLKDLLTGLVKSISFAWIITLIAVFRGLHFSGGAAGVGQATTASVVSSLFGIIVLDCLWGLVFYLR